jgi:hypothetical protein
LFAAVIKYFKNLSIKVGEGSDRAFLGDEKPGFFSELAKNLELKHEKPGFFFGYEGLGRDRY